MPPSSSLDLEGVLTTIARRLARQGKALRHMNENMSELSTLAMAARSLDVAVRMLLKEVQILD